MVEKFKLNRLAAKITDCSIDSLDFFARINRTSEFTKTISAVIEELRATITHAVEVIATCNDEMNSSLEQSSKANSSLEEIMGYIHSIEQMTSQIVESSHEQATATREINQNINRISELTEQSCEGNLKNADLITGCWYDVPKDYVDIPMKHRMSLVTIVYHVGTADYPDMDISEPQVYSKNNSVRFFIDQDQGKFVMGTPSGNSDWVKACKHDDGMFSAIVIPGSYKAGEIFVKFKIGDQNFHAKMKSNTEFQEGERYTYKLDVGKDIVKLTQISVDDLKGWTNEDELK